MFWIIRTFLIVILSIKIMLNQNMINCIYYLYVLRYNIRTGIVVNLYPSSNQKVKIISFIVLTSSSSDDTNFESESTSEATRTSNPTLQFQQHCEYSCYFIIGWVIIPCFLVWGNSLCWIHEYTRCLMDQSIYRALTHEYTNARILKQCTNTQTMHEFSNNAEIQYTNTHWFVL